MNVDDLKDVFEDATPARRDSSLSVEDVEELLPPRNVDPTLAVEELAELFPQAGPSPEPQPIAKPLPVAEPQPDVEPQDLMADLFAIVEAPPPVDTAPEPEPVEPDAELEAHLLSLAAAFEKLGAALGDDDPDAA